LKKFCALVVIVMTILILHACKKPDSEIDQIQNPTPAEVVIPAWVATSIVGEMPHPDENPLTLEGIELGRALFYEKKLSANNDMSCASCHSQEFSFSDSAQFSVGVEGELGGRQAMSIVNLAWDELFFWDGRAFSLEDQAFGPVVNPVELNETWPNVVAKLQADTNYPPLFERAFGTTTIDSVLVTSAIAQFERTLVSFDSDFDRFSYGNETDVLNEEEMLGFDLFFGEAECVHCHAGPLLNDPTFRNNGLDDTFADLGYGAITGNSSDDGKFKVSTLRNVAESSPYMHDGRFETLEEVIEHYNSGVIGDSPNLDPEMEHFAEGLDLTDEEKAALVAFLKTLSDDHFLSKEEFSDPN